MGAGTSSATAMTVRRALACLQPLLLPLVLGAAVLAVCLYLQMATPDALAAALAATGLALALRTLDKGADHAWTDVPELDTDGTRRDVAHVTWSLVGRDGRVSEAAVRRLRQDARRRLRRLGVDLPADFPTTSPARTGRGQGVPADGSRPGAAGPDLRDAEARARSLLGEPAWSVLTGTGGWLPTLDEVEQCVEALERLDRPQRTDPTGTTPTGSTPDGRTTS